MKITGELRPGSEFKLMKHAGTKAQAVFIAVLPDEIIVTRRLAELFHLPEETQVIANWHGHYRADAFATTIGELKLKAAA